MTSASHRVRRCDTAADAAEIHRLIYALAVYEKEVLLAAPRATRQASRPYIPY